MEKYQHPNPETNVVDDLFKNSPNSYVFDQTNEPPNKENSLYQTITQHWFYEIVLFHNWYITFPVYLYCFFINFFTIPFAFTIYTPQGKFVISI